MRKRKKRQKTSGATIIIDITCYLLFAFHSLHSWVFSPWLYCKTPRFLIALCYPKPSLVYLWLTLHISGFNVLNDIKDKYWSSSAPISFYALLIISSIFPKGYFINGIKGWSKKNLTDHILFSYISKKELRIARLNLPCTVSYIWYFNMFWLLCQLFVSNDEPF